MYCLEPDTKNPGTIYAGNLLGEISGLFRSTDCGATWDTLMGPDAAVRDIDIDPYNTAIIYVTRALEILKSTDNGKTWQKADAGINLGILQNMTVLEVDPSNPQKIFAGLGGLSGTGLYKSENGGTSWEIVRVASMNSVKSISCDRERPFYKYFGDFTSGSVFRSTDGGSTWHATSYERNEWGVSAILVNPRRSGVVYAGSVMGGFVLSEDYGDTWRQANDGLPQNSWVSDIALGHDKIYISATTDYGDAIYESTQDQISWTMVGNKIFDEWIRVIGYSPVNRILYAGGNGVYSYLCPTGVEDAEPIIPENGLMIENYPNPFNQQTRIKFLIPSSGNVTVSVYNSRGQLLDVIYDRHTRAGRHYLDWKETRHSSGIYYIELRFRDGRIMTKTVLLR